MRRYRDLWLGYAEQLGECLQREDVRLLTGQLISLTLLAERLQDSVAIGEPVDPNHVIQTTQTVWRLMEDLGLKPTRSDDGVVQQTAPQPAPVLRDYLATRAAGDTK